MSRWCLAVSHGLPRGWFLVWRCVLHGRVSSFFRASESSVRQFFCGAVLAGLGSCLGGVWLFRMGCREVGFWFGGAFSSFILSLGSESSVRQFFCGAVLAGLGSCLGGVWFLHGLPSVLHGRVSSFFRASESSVRQFFCGAVLAGLGSCLGGVWLFRMGCREVGFLVWRCVLHGRVSSFFRASESSVRQFFCGAVLAGLGSCLGGVWLFRMGCREVGLEVLDKATAWFCLVGFHLSLWFCTVEFHLSLGHQKAT